MYPHSSNIWGFGVFINFWNKIKKVNKLLSHNIVVVFDQSQSF
jgi:hypothetical protein